MAYKGIGSYSDSNQLAALLTHPRAGKAMLKKAYGAPAKKSEGKSHLNRTDTTGNRSVGYRMEEKSEAELAARLGKSTEAMKISSARLLDTDKMSDEELFGAVKQFAADYNETLDSLKDSENFVAKSSGDGMMRTMRSYAVPLGKAGVFINNDNTLSVDEELLKANPDRARSLFRTEYSLGGKMVRKASELNELSKLTGNSAAGIYDRSGLF